MEGTELTFVVDGAMLQGRFGRAKTEPDGPTVVLTHGLSGIVEIDLETFATGFIAQ